MQTEKLLQDEGKDAETIITRKTARIARWAGRRGFQKSIQGAYFTLNIYQVNIVTAID